VVKAELAFELSVVEFDLPAQACQGGHVLAVDVHGVS